jgi:hypothetical protein
VIAALLAHLERQIESARKLLGIVLAQADAIKRQDVEALLARLTDVQFEMRNREQLENERDQLIRGVAAARGVAPEEVDIDKILVGIPAEDAAQVRALSAELRGLLAEIGRTHAANRVLIRQELSFLDHLMRVLSGKPSAGYSPGGWTNAPQAANVVDARA